MWFLWLVAYFIVGIFVVGVIMKIAGFTEEDYKEPIHAVILPPALALLWPLLIVLFGGLFIALGIRFIHNKVFRIPATKAELEEIK